MKDHGYERSDLEYNLRKEDFREGESSAFDPKMKETIAVVQSMTTIKPNEIDDTIISLRFKHY